VVVQRDRQLVMVAMRRRQGELDGHFMALMVVTGQVHADSDCRQRRRMPAEKQQGGDPETSRSAKHGAQSASLVSGCQKEGDRTERERPSLARNEARLVQRALRRRCEEIRPRTAAIDPAHPVGERRRATCPARRLC
jgi:hypothetical protein